MPILIGAGLFVVGLVLGWLQIPWAPLGAYVAAYLVLGWQVLATAAKNLVKGHVFDENFLMSIATLGAFAIGEFPEAVGVMLFYRVGESVITGVTINTLPSKTEYWVGESLDATGLTLSATYSNGSTTVIANGLAVSGFSSATTGTKTVTVTYEGFTATFTVTVKEPTITGITVKTQPTKTEYWAGESLDTTGLTLTATYSDGSTEEITEGSM